MKTVVRVAAMHAVVVCAALMTAPGLVHAAVFCVGSSTQLQSPLFASASNGEHDTIRVRTGTCTGAGTSVAFAYSTSDATSTTTEKAQ